MVTKLLAALALLLGLALPLHAQSPDLETPLADYPASVEGQPDFAVEMEADALVAAIAEQKAAVAELETQLEDAGEAEKEGLQNQVAEAGVELDALYDRLVALVVVMQERGLDAVEHQKLLFRDGRWEPGALSVGATLGVLDEWRTSAMAWIREQGPTVIFKTMMFFLIVLIFQVIGKVVSRIVGRGLRTTRLNVSTLLRNFAVGIVYKTIFLFGIVYALAKVGAFDLGPVLAGLGVAGFIIGFALQDTLSNFASGLMILLYRPYDVGDFVNAGGIAGKVDAMSLVSTTLLTPDNQRVVVPNGKIWGDVITNVTANATRRCDLVVGVSYEDDVELVEKTLQEVVSAHELTLSEPEPTIRLNELGDSSVNFIVRPWVKTTDYWTVYWDLMRAIKVKFDEVGITIPYPQRDVHVFPTGGGSGELVAKGEGTSAA